MAKGEPGNRDDLVDVIYRCAPIRAQDWKLYMAACEYAASFWDVGAVRAARSRLDGMREEMKAAVWRRNQFYRGRRKDWRLHG
jgi:hypothetical protein